MPKKVLKPTKYNVEFTLSDEEASLREETRQHFNTAFEEFKEKGKESTIHVSASQFDLLSGEVGLFILEKLFISTQRGSGNSEATVKYYQRCFKKMYQFLAYTLLTKTDEYKNTNWDGRAVLGSKLPIKTLEMDDIEFLFREYLFNDSCNEQTVASYFRGFRAINYFAMENDSIKRRAIRINEPEPPIHEVYTGAELSRLLRKPSASNFTKYRNWVIINYLLGTGNRLGSIIELKVGDIDFENSAVNVNRQKNKKPSRISIPSKLVVVLIEYVKHYRSDDDGNPLSNAYLFCNKYGEQSSADAMKKAISEYNKSCKVTKTSIHLFRHTFAKTWILSGGDIITLATMLNHKDLAMVKRYANLWGTDLKPHVEEHSALSRLKTNSGQTLKSKKPILVKRNI